MPFTTENHDEIAHLLEAVERLSFSEIDTVEKRLQAVKAKQRAAMALTQDEKKRMAEIVREVPVESRGRYAALVEQQQEEILGDEQREELVRLSDWIEQVEVKRLEYLAEAARQRNVSLLTLMDVLCIKSPSYV